MGEFGNHVETLHVAQLRREPLDVLAIDDRVGLTVEDVDGYGDVAQVVRLRPGRAVHAAVLFCSIIVSLEPGMGQLSTS